MTEKKEAEEKAKEPDGPQPGHVRLVDQRTGERKDYELVASRLKRFRNDHPIAGEHKAQIIPSIIHCDDDVVRMRVEIRLDTIVVAVGHGEEYRADTGINAYAALENCETSALGRALAFAGYASADSIASAEEVTGAEKKAKVLDEATPGALVLLQNAAPRGLAALEEAFAEIGKEGRQACRKYMPNLKRIAAKADETRSEQ